MNEKNTQIDEKPTKRQYKHTPKGEKRLTSRIFALVACLLLLVNFALPVFADSSLSSTSTNQLENMSPRLPVDRFYFPNTAYGTRVQFGSPFVLYERSSGSTAKDSVRFPMQLASDDISPSGIYNTLDFQHYYNAERSVYTNFSYEAFDWWSLCSNSTTSAGYYFTEMEIYYQTATLDSRDLPIIVIGLDSHINPANLRLHVEADYDVTTTDFKDSVSVTKNFEVVGYSGADNPLFACHIYDVFAEDYLALAQYYTISNLHVRLTFVTSTDGNTVSPSTDDGYFEYRQTFDTLRDYREIQTHAPNKLPETIDTTGLFDWIANGLRGVLSTPLIPIGAYSISIGSILSVFLGILLVVAFLKIFAGG